MFTIPETFYPTAYIRNVLGIIFVLFLPGFAFIKALFPTTVPLKTTSESLDDIERIALSFGMSLALVPIVVSHTQLYPMGHTTNSNHFELACVNRDLCNSSSIKRAPNKTASNKKPRYLKLIQNLSCGNTFLEYTNQLRIFHCLYVRCAVENYWKSFRN